MKESRHLSLEFTHTHSEVLALVGDYLAQAAAHDAIPMATTLLRFQ